MERLPAETAHRPDRLRARCRSAEPARSRMQQAWKAPVPKARPEGQSHRRQDRRQASAGIGPFPTGAWPRHTSARWLPSGPIQLNAASLPAPCGTGRVGTGRQLARPRPTGNCRKIATRPSNPIHIGAPSCAAGRTAGIRRRAGTCRETGGLRTESDDKPVRSVHWSAMLRRFL